MARFSSEIQAGRQYIDGNEGEKSLLKLLVLIRVHSISGLNNLNFLVRMLLKNAIHPTPHSLN